MRVLAGVLAGVSMFAGVTLQETTEFGGAMVELMKSQHGPDIPENLRKELALILEKQICKISMEGRRDLSDCGNQATLIDYDRGEVLSLNRTERTYQRLTLMQLRQSVEAIFGQIDTASKAAGKPPDVSFRETGARRTVGPYDCRVVEGSIDLTLPLPQGPTVPARMTFDFCLGQSLPGEEQLLARGQEMSKALGFASSGSFGAIAPLLGPKASSTIEQIIQSTQTLYGVALSQEVSITAKMPGAPSELSEKPFLTLRQTITEIKAEPFVATELKIPDGYTDAGSIEESARPTLRRKKK